MTRHRGDAPERLILTYDIGGTNVRAGLYDHGTQQLRLRAHRHTVSIATKSEFGADSLWDELSAQMLSLARELLGCTTPEAVAVAFPAPLDENGRAIAMPTLLGKQGQGLPIRRLVHSLWPASRVVVLNDLAAAGYRYVDRWQDFCIVTVGSGVGHKIFLGGQPQAGPHGRGGECGHLVVSDAPDAPVCDCGGRGHLGAMASGRGAVRLAQWRALGDLQRFQASTAGRRCAGRPELLDTYGLVEGFHGGDLWVESVINEAASLLGRVLAGMHLAMGTEIFILVGGFALGLGEQYRALVATAAEASCWRVGQDWHDMVRLGEPDDDHGMIGGARHLATLSAYAPLSEPVPA